MENWTEKEIEIILREYSIGGSESCLVLLPNRTKASIHQKAKELNIKFINEIRNKYNREPFTKIVMECKSYSDVCKKFSLKPKQTNRARIRKYIELYNIDISHFTYSSDSNEITIKSGIKFKTTSDYSKLSHQGNVRKIHNRPTYETLMKDVIETNFLVTGRKYNVSDNTIRKWIKGYEKQLGIEPLKSFLKSVNFNSKLKSY